MVREVFRTHFDAGLKSLSQFKKDPDFEAAGFVFNNEIVLAVSLLMKDQMAATTVHASCDFDGKASAPTAPEILGLCVDALGSVFSQLFDPEKPDRIESLAGESLSAMEDIPFEWTPLTVEGRKIWLKVDKSNPKLDQMAEDWLDKHDPDRIEREKIEHKKTEKLFVTGAPRKSSETPDDDDTFH